jgi:predicted dehydrogenase
MSESPLHVAILGCGYAAELNGPVLRALGAECSYASRDGEKARRFAARFGGRGSFSSYEAACGEASVEAVLVATPPSTHLDLTLAALRAGKHVIVEKPPFLRSTDFDLIARTAREADRRALVAENYHYKPLARVLRRLLAEGAIGDPLFLHVNALKRQAVPGWRADAALAGGGALFEGGIHWVNFMANLGPTVRAVRGFSPRGARDERGLLAVFEYEGGPIGTLSYSWEVPSALGGLRFSRFYGREGSIGFESNGLVLGLWGRRKRLVFPGARDLVGRKAMWRDFLRALGGGVEPEYDLLRARRDLELVEQIYATLR